MTQPHARAKTLFVDVCDDVLVVDDCAVYVCVHGSEAYHGGVNDGRILDLGLKAKFHPLVHVFGTSYPPLAQYHSELPK